MSRRALFIAPQYDGKYAPPLPGASNVERELKDLLEGKGAYEFRSLRRTLRRPEFNRQIRELTDTSREILLYFYGHGVRRSSAAYFVTSDGEPDDEGVAMREVIEAVFESRAQEVVIILDCCHAGMAASVDKDAMAASTMSSLSPGRVLIGGCAAHQQGWVEDIQQKKVGVFSWHILEGLKGRASLPTSGDVRGSSLGTYVSDSFRAWNQSPFCVSRESGDLRCVITAGFSPTSAVDDRERKAASARVLGVPFRPSLVFVGRNAELETLRTRLIGDGRPVAVSATVEGLGGVGKTELVIQLLAEPELLQTFATITWLDGAGPLPPQWQKIGEELGLRLHALEPEALVQRISAKLRTLGRTLVILDNATEWRAVEQLIPPEMSLLVTTRTRDFGGTSFRHLELDILSGGAARELLVRLVPRLETDSGLPRLIATLNGHALALEIAAGNINTLDISAAEYLTRLDTRTPDPMAVVNIVKHGKTVDECLKLSWDSLKTDGARILWRRAALFAPTSAHRELLRVSFDADRRTHEEVSWVIRERFPGEAGITAVFPGNFDDAYGELRARNVFSRVEGAGGERWAMHRLVRDFGRARLRSIEFMAHSMAISEWLRHPSLPLRAEVPHLVALILDSAKFGSEFEGMAGRRSPHREALYRSSELLLSSDNFLSFIREELSDPRALILLLEGLTDPNDDVRKQAIVILETLHHIPEVVEGVASALDDPDPGVRARARETIIESGSEPVILILERTLASNKPRAKIEAARCLGHLGERAIPALRLAFENETGDMKVEAALALAHLGVDVGLTEIARQALGSTNNSLRTRALKSIKALNNATVDSIYLKAIDDQNQEIVATVLDALKGYDNAEVVQQAVLHVIDSTASLPARQGIVEHNLQQALDIVSARRIPIPVELTATLLESETWFAAEKAAESLAWNPGNDLSALFTVALHHDDSDVREAAIVAAVKRRDVTQIAAIRKLAAEDPDDSVKESAADALPVLEDAAQGQSPLGDAPDKPSVATLLSLLNGGNLGLREGVLKRVGKLRDPAADETLLKIATTASDEPIRRCAAVALLRVRCQYGREAEPQEDCGTAEFLDKHSFMNATELIETLKVATDENLCPMMMRALARTFAVGSGRDRAADVEEMLLKFSTSDDRESQIYAIAALSNIKQSNVTNALIRLLNDGNPQISRQAAIALGLVGDASARDVLQARALNQGESPVSAAACHALSELTRRGM